MKIQPPDSVPTISLPALSKQDLKAGPDWLDVFYNRMKHKLEVPQTVSIFLGNETLEDFGPNSANGPIFCTGQRAAVIDLARLQAAVQTRIQGGRSSELVELVTLSQRVSVPHQTEIQRAMLSF